LFSAAASRLELGRSSAGRLPIVALLVAVVATCSDGGEIPENVGGDPRRTEAGATHERSSQPSTDTAAGLRAAYIASVQQHARQEYSFEGIGGRAVGRTPSQGIHASLGGGTLRVESDTSAAEWSVSLRWTGIGRGDAVGSVERPTGAPQIEANRATHRRRDGSEDWYLNGPLGMEQGFVIAEPPQGRGELVLVVSVAGLVPTTRSGASHVTLEDGMGSVRLRYGELFASDADGSPLPARLTVRDGSIALHVDDTHARYPLYVDPLLYVHQQILLASDGAAGDQLGEAVCVSGSYAIVGAMYADAAGTDRGAAYVYERSGAGTWSEVAVLTASDGADDDRFGISVGLSGSYAAVGAPRADAVGSDSGAVYVFERSGTGIWSEHAKLTASNAGTDMRFGHRVSLSGTYALATRLSGGRGAGYVFERSGAGIWTEQGVLTGTGAYVFSDFGISACISGSYAVIGAWDDDGNESHSGAAYVFERSGTGTWSEQAKLTASDGATFDYFGISVAVAGTEAIVGAYHADVNASGDGAAYVFQRSGAGEWTEQQKLTTAGATTNSAFGYSVSLAPPYALIGATNRAFVFARSATSAWVEQQRLTATLDGSIPNFGAPVSIDGAYALAAARGDGTNGDNAGAAYVFEHLCYGQPDGTACDDHLFCNGADRCLAGACDDHDGDPCAANVGDADTDCSESCNEAADDCTADDPDGSACDDGQFCTTIDQCTNGTCTHSGNPCAANVGDADADCSESCNEATDDCTADDPSGSACDDGSFCNGTETCTAGACGSSTGDPCAANVGDDDAECSESCNEATDDCTADDPDGSACDDGSFCNGTETCAAGACGSSTGDPCLARVDDGDGDCSESCDEARDECAAPDPDGAECDDGSFCNGSETCTAGTCGNSTGDPCTGPDGDEDCAESCDDSANDCSGADPDGSSCPVGACSNGTCQPPGTGGGGPSDTLDGDNEGRGVDQGGCGCRTAGHGSQPSGLALAALAALACAGANRRRRRARLPGTASPPTVVVDPA
jgi:hypothetical protein